MHNGGTYFTMQKPTEIAKQIADLIRGDQIAALQVREFLTADELVDLLGLHDYVDREVLSKVREQLTDAEIEIDRLRDENHLLEREADGLRDEIDRLEVDVRELTADNHRLEALLSGKAQD